MFCVLIGQYLNGPADGVRGATGHAGHLDRVETLDQSWLLVDTGAAGALLTMVIVTPGVHMASVSHRQAVQGSHNHVDDLLATYDSPLWLASSHAP